MEQQNNSSKIDSLNNVMLTLTKELEAAKFKSAEATSVFSEFDVNLQELNIKRNKYLEEIETISGSK